jgi:hypothetical protein
MFDSEAYTRQSETRSLWKYVNRISEPDPVAVIRFSLKLVDGRWRSYKNAKDWRTARGLFIFIVKNGKLYASKRAQLEWRSDPVGHVDLARGDFIHFGGEIQFGGSYSRRGKLVSWNDKTGHYFDPEYPMDPSVVPMLPISLFNPYRQEN